MHSHSSRPVGVGDGECDIRDYPCRDMRFSRTRSEAVALLLERIGARKTITRIMVIWGLAVVSSVDNFVKPWLISQGSDMPFILIFFGVLGGAPGDAPRVGLGRQRYETHSVGS